MFERWLRWRGVAAGVLALGLASCGSDDGVGEGAEPVPTVLEQGGGGCGDAFLWAATAEGDAAVTVTVEARSRSTVESTVIEFTLPDPELTVDVQRGQALTQPFCNDVVDGTAHRIDTRQTGIAGSGRITLGPRRESSHGLPLCGVDGELRLEGLVAEDGTRFGDIDIETDQMGCYVG